MTHRRLLLVDADPAVLETLRAALARDEREIEAACDGAEALRRAAAAAYDLVVAGQGRSGAGGAALARRLSAVQSQARVIVIGDGTRAGVIAAIRARAYSYHHKPVLAGPLADMARMALDATSWRDDVRLVSATPAWIEFEIRCKLEAAERATHFLRELETDLPASACEDVAAAFRELLLNAVEHGGRSNPKKRARASVVRAGRALVVHLRDPGKGFSMQLLSHAAISNPAGSPTRHLEVRAEQQQRPGGFGILMARSLTDELVYSERGNEALFIKYLK